MREDLLFYGSADMYAVVEHRRGQIKERIERGVVTFRSASVTLTFRGCLLYFNQR